VYHSLTLPGGNLVFHASSATVCAITHSHSTSAYSTVLNLNYCKAASQLHTTHTDIISGNKSATRTPTARANHELQRNAHIKDLNLQKIIKRQTLDFRVLALGP